MFLKASKAVLLMVVHGMVLRRADRDEGLELIWWSDRCSCFHCLKAGEFSGIYTHGVFHNLMPFFKYRSEYNDHELLYQLDSQAKEMAMYMLEERSSMEVLYANNTTI